MIVGSVMGKSGVFGVEICHKNGGRVVIEKSVEVCEGKI